MIFNEIRVALARDTSAHAHTHLTCVRGHVCGPPLVPLFVVALCVVGVCTHCGVVVVVGVSLRCVVGVCQCGLRSLCVGCDARCVMRGALCGL